MVDFALCVAWKLNADGHIMCVVRNAILFKLVDIFREKNIVIDVYSFWTIAVILFGENIGIFENVRNFFHIFHRCSFHF